MKRKTFSILFTLVLVLSFGLVTAVPALANDVSSSTMHFEGDLTYAGGGVYTGTIAMTAGEYYVIGGGGEEISTTGGFDVYAKWGGCAYVMDYYGIGDWNCGGIDTFLIGSDHDAYPNPPGGGPWGSWYDPDCADWDQYSLELTADHWYLRYTATGESPMSGILIWNGDGTGYAAETDKGTSDPDDIQTGPYGEYEPGGPQMWDWDAGAQVERIPLQFPGFNVVVTSGGSYEVTMTPAAAPSGVSLAADVVDIIAISVGPTSIDFGTIYPGSASSVTIITVNNIGTKPVDVDSLLNPATGTVFDYLELGGWAAPHSNWPGMTGLAAGGSNTVGAQLVVPAAYPAGVDPETATLTFEAVATGP